MSTATLHNEKKKTLIPELRFKEFDGEWEEKIMRDICKINQGLQIPISERFYEKADNNYFYITNEFLRKDSAKSYFIKNPSESVICYEADILMTRTGNTGQVVTNVHGAFHNNFFKIKYNSTCDKWFLYYFLTSYKTQGAILKLAGTSTIPDLNHGDFYKIAISIPTFPEQQKITSFLSSVDEKIQQLSRKKELLSQYKKGVMQQLFSGKLRFKDENGKDYADWEEKKLGDVCKLNPKSSLLPSSFIYIDLESVVNGQLLKETRIQLIEAPSRAQRLLSSEDILFQMVRPYQKNNLFFTKNGEYVASTGYAQLRAKESSMFLYQLIHTTDFVNKVIDRCTGTSYPAINSTDLSNIEISIPSIKEQQKIANFLSSIDTKIESTSQQITQTQSFKKGLLQQLFV